MKHLVLLFIYKIVIYTLNLNIGSCLRIITGPPYLTKLIFGFHQKSCQKLVYIYTCFGFTDGKHYIIKYNKELFDSFDTKYISKWKSANYLIPLDQCISLAAFVDVIKLTAPCY